MTLKTLNIALDVTHKKHRESLAQDRVEEILGRGSRDHEEVAQKQVLPTRVINQRKLMTAEQAVKRVLQQTVEHNNSYMTGYKKLFY